MALGDEVAGACGGFIHPIAASSRCHGRSAACHDAAGENAGNEGSRGAAPALDATTIASQSARRAGGAMFDFDRPTAQPQLGTMTTRAREVLETQHEPTSTQHTFAEPLSNIVKM